METVNLIPLGTFVLLSTGSGNRGVFVGVLGEYSLLQGSVQLFNARMIFSWEENQESYFGLAAKGPVKGTLVSPSIPEVLLTHVTNIVKCSPEALRAFECC